MSAAIQPDEVVAFWRHMQERFGTTTVNKADAVESNRPTDGVLTVSRAEAELAAAVRRQLA